MTRDVVPGILEVVHREITARHLEAERILIRVSAAGVDELLEVFLVKTTALALEVRAIGSADAGAPPGSASGSNEISILSKRLNPALRASF